MIIQAKPKALHLRHPELACPAMAEIIENWYENGRFTGYVLKFSGEHKTRHLRFAEIRALQEEATHESTPA